MDPSTVQAWMGHASIAITLDRYGHLMPGFEAEAAGLLDAYLAGNEEAAAAYARSARSAV